MFSVSQSKFLVFGCPIWPSASINGILCAPHVVICIREQRFPSHIKPPVFLEQHGNPRAAFPSALMNSSRGIPGVQSPSGAPLPTFILLWKMYHPAGRPRGGREQWQAQPSTLSPFHCGITHWRCPPCHGEPVAPSAGDIPCCQESS